MTTPLPPPSPTASLAALQAFVQAMPMARTLGLRFVHAEAGRVEVEIPVTEAFSFRPGQLQATAVFAVADFAADVFAADVFAVDGSGQETLCATLLATARNIEPAPPAVGRRRAGVSPASAAPARRPPTLQAPARSAPG